MQWNLTNNQLVYAFMCKELYVISNYSPSLESCNVAVLLYVTLYIIKVE